MEPAIEIIEADLKRLEHQRHVRALTAAYALDPMGNGGPLPVDVLDRLIPGLQNLPTTVIFLAYMHGVPVGIATCFVGFSTFLGRPLLNIHDLAVVPEHRGTGIGRRLLAAVEQKARALGCGRLTLEVQEDNARARRTYERIGFKQTVYSETAGGALFYSKSL